MIIGAKRPEIKAGTESEEYQGDHTLDVDAAPLPESRDSSFPVTALPAVLKEFVEAHSQAIGCDPTMVALPALATVASAIGNARWIKLRYDWREPPAVWTAVISESGTGKSPAHAAAVDPLMGLQMAPGVTTCYVTTDATIEAVAKLLAANPKGILVAPDELDGWFQSMTRYKSGSSDRPHWLGLHRGGGIRVDRASKDTISVRRAIASVCGTIQPGVWARALDQEAQDSGIGARLLKAMPAPRRRVWTEVNDTETASQSYRSLLQSLLFLELTNEEPNYVELDLAAKEHWEQWFNEWNERRYEAEGAEAATLAKLESYAARLALIHHIVGLSAASNSRTPDVCRDSIQAGIDLVEWFAREDERINSLQRETKHRREQRRLVEKITARGGSISVRALQNSNSHRYRTSEDAEAELAALVKDKLGRWVEKGSPPSGGHSDRHFELHLPTDDASDTRMRRKGRVSEVSSVGSN